MEKRTETAADCPATDKPFFYTEECGLALMKNRRSGKKLGMDKDMWKDVVSSIAAGRHPGMGQGNGR